LRLDTIDGKGKSKYGSSSNPLVMEVKEAAHYAGLVSSDMFNPKTGIYGYSHPEPAPGLNSTTWPGPTIVARSYQKLYVKWENKILPGPHIIRPLNNTSTTGAADVVDTTLHWAYSLPKALVNGTNYTYTDYSIASNGTPIVPHLHGGHTAAGFDGNPEYFFSKDFAIKGPQWETEVYRYDNDQPAGTLWYHDHALGITRLNVYAGLAGFYILYDDFDTGDYDNKAGLPYGDKEHAFAIQDRMFKENGDLFYPAFPGDPYYEGFIDDEGADLTNDTLFPYPTGRTEGNGGVSKVD
jgi:FtsP/CotA-like multicopper oxidase with cupredoxin domain